MDQLFLELNNHGISLSLDQENLLISFDGDAIPESLISKIKESKTELISYLKKYAAEDDFEEIQPAGKQKNYPISFAQKRLWVSSQYADASLAYMMPKVIDLPGDLQLGLFKKAVNAVIERHESLRTIFKEDEHGEVRQWILSAGDLGFNIQYLDFSNNENSEQQFADFVQQDGNVLFDLSKGPLIRASLVKISEKKYSFYYVLHHIITDGWSMGVLAEDVIKFYDAFVRNEAPRISNLEIQYKDYTVWQIDQLKNGKYDADKHYWLKKLKEPVPPIDLPGNKIRPRVKSHNGEVLEAYLSGELTAKIKKFTQEQEGSLFITLLSIWNVLLYRYTQQEEIVVGSSVAGRYHAALENQIGFFVNTLALKNRISPGEPFKSIYHNIKNDTFEAYAHQNYPFDLLVEDLQIERDNSRNILFDIVLVGQNAADLPAGFSIEETKVNTITSLGKSNVKFDLEIGFFEYGNNLLLNIYYNTDVYDRSSIENIIEHFRNLSSRLVDTDEAVGKINFLAKNERFRLLVDFNDTVREYPKEKTVLDLFEEQAQKNPDGKALMYNDTVLTYGELLEAVNNLAHYLQYDIGVQPEDLVAIKLERSQWMIVTILGILRSGAAFVPIDPAYPRERIDYILHDSGAKVMICEKQEQVEPGSQPEVKIILTDELEKITRETKERHRMNHIGQQQLAYVIYTSGSTGTPKGCQLSHGNLFNYIQWANDYYFTEPGSGNWALITSFSFDLTFTSIFTSLTRGKKLWIGDAKKDISVLLQECFAHPEIDTLKLTPTHLTLVKAYGIVKTNIDRIICGGEQLTFAQLNAIWDIKKDIKIYNEYGPTEATVGCIVKEITSNDDKITIGKPIANTEIYILDNYRQPCPAGVLGEIYISGAGLSTGYLNKPELTSQKFIDNPFKDGAKMYKTGDLGKWSADGDIEYLGRSDDQVKIKGFRIELGEIEYHLEQKEGINQAVVLVHEGNEIKELVAYIVSNAKTDISSLRNHLLERVPGYMIPAYFIQLDKLPLTPNGKLDKKALPVVDEAGAAENIEFIAPETKEEITLAKIWQGVLKKEPIGKKSNFYHLGGDSIKSILVVSRLKKEGYALKLSDILESPVLEDLVLLMNKLDKVSDQSEVSGEVALTPVQHYFFRYEGIVDHHHYNQSVVLKSSDEINLTHIDQCLSFLVKHHDVLRMKYKKEGKEWKQYNAASSPKSYECLSYNLTGEPNPLERINHIGQELQTRFDLSEGPLFKAAHFKTADGEYLALVIHHLVVDGVSWRILLEDLFTLYSQAKKGVALKLPLKSDSFQKWATLQKELAAKEKITAEAAYWKEICNAAIPELKTDYPVSGKNIFDKKIHFTLDSEATNLLKTAVNDKYNTEINDVLLTGLAMALKGSFGVEKSMIKMEGHGREDITEGVDISRTVGWFTSIYPVILNIANTNRNADALVQVKEDLRRIPNKGIGYGMLKYLNGSYGDWSFVPAIIFNYLGEFSIDENKSEAPAFQYAAVAIGDNISKNNREEVLLDVSGSITANTLTIAVAYSGAAFSDETVNRFAQSYKTALAGLIRELSAEKGVYKTPSDLSYKKLTVNELNLVNTDNNIEDIYELSPLQQGIYFHWLKSGISSLYFEQLSYRVHINNVDINAIALAYKSLVHRHAILRTSFDNHLADVPLQIVRKTVHPGFLYKKLPGYVKEESIPGYVKEFKQADIDEGFDLAHHSLMRLKILDLGKDRFEFVWSHHHILMDGWCMGILINDFNLLLQAIVQHKEAGLPRPLPYSNYINWLNRINVNTSLAYWKQYLEGYNNVASVPFLKENPVNEYKDAMSIVRFEGQVRNRLNEMCNEIGITQNTFIQAVWGFVLSKYNNTNDVVYGGVVSGRPAELPGVEDMVGLFINTIPIRVRYNSEETPLELFKKLKEDAISGNAHHYISLAKIQNQSELSSELINNIIVFENYLVKDAGESNPGNAAAGENFTRDLAIESVDVFEQTNYDFNILVSPSNNSLQVCFKFNSNKYDETLIAGSVEHFYTVAEQFISFKDKALKEIGLVAENEWRLIEQFNATKVEFEQGITVLDLLSETVEQHGQMAAVSYKEKTLTYGELNEESGRLANYLRSQYDVQPNDLVGIKLERSERMILSILGILRSGGAYVPIDTNYPEERIAYIKADSNCKLCIDEEFLETFDKEKNKFKTSVEGVNISGNNTAYAIYTSGSTGNPKGVLNEHAGLYNRLLWMRDDLGINASDVILQKTPYTFDVSVWELLMPSIAGCKLVYAEPEGHKDPAYLQNLIQSNEITIIHFVPSMLGIFLEEMEAGKCKSLRHVVCSGEALPAVMVEEFKQKLPWVRIHNLYGPTEAGIDVTSVDLTEVDTKEHGVTIGKPVANTKIFIVDKYMSLQPVGVPGELLIEGIQVARGYLNRPELTAEKFIESPFNKGERIYRTGDLAKWLPNGEIAYIGRIDNQVKIRGNRIELGEIEAAIMLCGYVENVAVLVKEETGSRKYLVAYVIPGPGYQQEALFSYLKERLPDYMIPAVVMEMDEFPLTSSGKLNRKLLPTVNDGAGAASEAYTAPGNETESALAAIWEEVLRLDRVGIHDNFFRIGGDSIIAIRLVSKINKKFGIALTIAQLYDFNTIAELGSQVTNNISNAENKKRIKDEIKKKISDLKQTVLMEMSNPGTVEDIYPMSDIQKGMVILSTLNPGAGVYHDQFIFQVPAVDLSLFRRSFSKLIRKHGSLRTRFNLTEYSEEVQIVEKEVDFEIDYRDIRNMDSARQEKLVSETMSSERQRPFDFEAGLLWRIHLFKTSDASMVFLFQFHHAILDGWSVASLNTELFKSYRELENAADVNIGTLKSNYRDAVIEELVEKNNPEAIKFWQDELADYKRLDIFANRFENKTLVKSYGFDFKIKLEEKCRRDGISVKTLMYAAFVYALKTINFDDDFVIGMVTNNRPVIEDGDKILGCFLNTTPVRNRLNEISNLTWGNYFKNTEKRLTGLKSKERLTLYEISRITNEEKIEGSPFFDVLFNYVDFYIYNELQLEQDDEYSRSQGQGLDIESFETTNTAFDLNINLSGKGLTFGYKLRRGLSSHATLEQIHEYIMRILSVYLESPDTKIRDTRLLSEEELGLLNVFNATRKPYADQTTVLDLLNETVEQHGQKAAVSYKEKTLTYRELNEESGRLANYLRSQYDVQPNDLVGIKLERSEKMILAILGILRSGGAYVPIDTNYPEERITYIKADSNCKLCIDEDFLEAFGKEKDNFKTSVEGVTISGSNTAYAIYTSGSTGNPKGVLNEHAGLYNRLLWMRDDLGINASDVILQKTPYTFDVSVWELLMPSITGCKLVFAEPEGHKDPAYLQNLIQSAGVTIIHFVPSMLGIFLEELEAGKCKSLRHVVCSGEALAAVMVEEFKQKLPWVRIHNLYGPTEAGIDVTSVDLTEVDTKEHGVTIGKPVANTKIYIVDKYMSLQPVGVPGELLIEGVQVARGYLNRPELTAEKFIESPFNKGERIYRTGDLAKWLPNGEIAYIGRIDNQVKIRGNRIELGEIEAAIMLCGYVENVAVLVKEETGSRKYLVAYVIPGPGYQQEALFSYLKERLPDYMIPAVVMEMDEFPLTSSGKLNRKLLPTVNDGAGTASEAYTAPGNETESALAAIWKEVLRLDRVGIHDNFFRIGGDSIIAIRLISKVNKKLDVAFTITQLYQYNTIAGMSDQIRNSAISFEQNRKVRDDIKGSFDSYLKEVMGS